jgi:hypothetical protein
MSDGDDEKRPGARLAASRPLLIGGLVLALAATVALVASDSVRWLRLGVIAALWAALAGAFIAARFRRDAAERSDEIDTLHNVYELELEREIAARREHELEIAAEAQRTAEERNGEQLAQLQKELRLLRENLETLLGGEVLVERVALRAESTRMRSIPDNPHRAGGQGAIAGGSKAQQTGVRRPANVNARQDEQRPARRDAARTDAASQTDFDSRPQRESPPPPARRPATPSQSRPSAGEGVGPQGQQVPNGDRPTGHVPGIAPDWTPSWENRYGAGRSDRGAETEASTQQTATSQQAAANQRAINQQLANQQAHPAANQRPEQPPQQQPQQRQQQQAQQQSRQRDTRSGDGAWPLSWRPEPAAKQAEPRANATQRENTSSPAPERTDIRPPGAAAAAAAAAHNGARTNFPPNGAPARDEQPATAPTPVEDLAAAQPEHGGRRRRPESVSFADSFGTSTDQPSGRHGVPADTAPQHSGSHAKPEPAPAPEQVAEPGAHAAGMAVSDLLAAHGVAETPRRRRRRED